MPDDIRLETERLILSEIEANDWEAIHRYASDPAVVRFMSWGPNSEEDSKDFVRRVQAQRREDPRKEVQLGITRKIDGQLIGAIGMWRTGHSDCREAEIGYCLNRDFWSKGYTTEAAKAIIAFGFKGWGMHRIHARVDPENLGSERVLQKAGMRLEGHLRKNDWVSGQWRDTLIYAILDEEYSG